MKQEKEKTDGRLLVLLLTFGVFGIINTEMGVVGIIPLIAETFGVTVPEAGWTVSIFAGIVALSAPVLPLLFSRFDRKKVMLTALGLFTAANLVSAAAEQFAVVLAARALPAFLHPVYVSMAFTAAAAAVPKDMVPKASAKVFVGVSAGMVLGVPVTSFIASHTSFSAAMLFFAAVNGLGFLGTLLLMPSMPPEKKTLGAQLAVLRRPVLLWSAAAFTFINGAMFGFFSFMTDFLHRVSGMSFDGASAVLLGYGAANIAGNLLAGRFYSERSGRWKAVLPAALGAGYLLLFAAGSAAFAAGAVILLLGVLAGFASVAGQSMITSAAPEAPDFANGLFLTAANFGTMAGTAFCGLFITLAGTRFSLAGALLFLLAAALALLFRARSAPPALSEPM